MHHLSEQLTGTKNQLNNLPTLIDDHWLMLWLP